MQIFVEEPVVQKMDSLTMKTNLSGQNVCRKDPLNRKMDNLNLKNLKSTDLSGPKIKIEGSLLSMNVDLQFENCLFKVKSGRKEKDGIEEIQVCITRSKRDGDISTKRHFSKGSDSRIASFIENEFDQFNKDWFKSPCSSCWQSCTIL